MPSGSQLNRWGLSGGIPLLALNAGCAAMDGSSTALNPLLTWGTIGGNTPNDSGCFVTPIGMQTWTFQIVQSGAVAPTGYTVTLYGCIDPLAYQAYTVNGGADGFKSVTGTSGPTFNQTFAVPATSFAPLPGPSEQSGTGASANPITATGIFFQAKIALVAVRAVLTAVNSPAGNALVLGFAVP